MLSISVIKGNKKCGYANQTNWKRFKDVLSETKDYFRKRRENAVKKAIEDGNVGKIIKLLNKIDSEHKRECVEYLLKNESARYCYKDCKRIYDLAKQEDGVYSDLTVKIYKKLEGDEKDRFLRKIDKELKEKLFYLKWGGQADEIFKTIMKIYVEIGKDGKKTNLAKYYSMLKDIVYNRNNPLQTRMHALEILYTSDYGDMEFWKNVVTWNSDLDQHQLANYGLKLLLKKEVEGSELLFLKNLNMIAKRLVELSYEPGLGAEEKKRLIGFITSTLNEGSDEQKVILLRELNLSKKLHGGLRNKKMAEVILRILNRYNKAHLEESRRLEKGLREAKKKLNDIEKGLLKESIYDINEFVSKVEEELKRYKLTEELVFNALLFLFRIQWCPENIKNKLLDILEVENRTSRITRRIGKLFRYCELSDKEINRIINRISERMKKRIEMEDILDCGRLYHATICQMPLKEEIGAKLFFSSYVSLEKMIASLLDSAHIEDNVAAGEILISLRELEEAKRLIRELAIPEFRELATDRKIGKKNIEIAKGVLKQLENTV